MRQHHGLGHALAVGDLQQAVAEALRRAAAGGCGRGDDRFVEGGPARCAQSGVERDELDDVVEVGTKQLVRSVEGGDAFAIGDPLQRRGAGQSDRDNAYAVAVSECHLPHRPCRFPDIGTLDDHDDVFVGEFLGKLVRKMAAGRTAETIDIGAVACPTEAIEYLVCNGRRILATVTQEGAPPLPAEGDGRQVLWAAAPGNGIGP